MRCRRICFSSTDVDPQSSLRHLTCSGKLVGSYDSCTRLANTPADSSVERWIYKPGADNQSGRRWNFFFLTKIDKDRRWLIAILYSPSIGMRWFSQLFVLGEPETVLSKHLLGVKSLLCEAWENSLPWRDGCFLSKNNWHAIVSAVFLSIIRPWL